MVMLASTILYYPLVPGLLRYLYLLACKTIPCWYMEVGFRGKTDDIFDMHIFWDQVDVKAKEKIDKPFRLSMLCEVIDNKNWAWRSCTFHYIQLQSKGFFTSWTEQEMMWTSTEVEAPNGKKNEDRKDAWTLAVLVFNALMTNGSVEALCQKRPSLARCSLNASFAYPSRKEPASIPSTRLGQHGADCRLIRQYCWLGGA